MSKPCEVVVTGALMHCNRSIGLSEITCTHSGADVQGKTVCNTNDTIVGPNFKPSAFGFCFALKSTCRPLGLKFDDPGPGINFGAGRTVEKSTPCRCMIGGTIKFITSGQSKIPPSTRPNGPLGVDTFIQLVAKVEADNPGKSKEEIIGALRRLGNYDTVNFQNMYGTGPAFAIQYSSPSNPHVSLTKDELDQLTSMLRHNVDAQGVETGVVYDRYGNAIAMGHVMTGITAGLRRNRSFDPNESKFTGIVGDEVDTLYATTIAGDLGQSAHTVDQGEYPNLIGPDSEATFAELRGDLDGVMIGESLDNQYQSDAIYQNWMSDAPASAFLQHYFDNYSGVRMRNAMNWLPNQNDEGYLWQQTEAFATNYKFFKEGFWGKVDMFNEDPRRESIEAVREFEAWLEEEFNKEEGFGKITRGSC